MTNNKVLTYLINKPIGRNLLVIRILDKHFGWSYGKFLFIDYRLTAANKLLYLWQEKDL